MRPLGGVQQPELVILALLPSSTIRLTLSSFHSVKVYQDEMVEIVQEVAYWVVAFPWATTSSVVRTY